MIPNPIRRVLSSMRAHGVRALLMGGQACVFYGAAEFSRDADFAIPATSANLARLRNALKALGAEPIAVPPLEAKFLRKGHAAHFRCRHADAFRIRIDLMAKMRGVDSFEKLWKRRTILRLPSGEHCELLSLPDLTQAKKTQRDKDWPMIRRLLEADFFEHRQRPGKRRLRFWLEELRTPELLIEVAQDHPNLARKCFEKRPLIRPALSGDHEKVEAALKAEETAERKKDRLYWLPLRAELERMRRSRTKT